MASLGSMGAPMGMVPQNVSIDQKLKYMFFFYYYVLYMVLMQIEY